MTAISAKKRIRLETQNDTLVSQARSGCKDAFQQLVQSHQQLVRVYLSKHFRCSNQRDDIAQEVFLAAYKQIHRFRDQSTFSTWLLGIAKNKTLQFLRMDVRRKKNEQAMSEANEIQQRIKMIDAEQLEVEAQRIDALRVCLSSLPGKSSQLIQAFYFEKETSNEIANRLNEKDGAIRMRLKRIREALQACISKKLNLS